MFVFCFTLCVCVRGGSKAVTCEPSPVMVIQQGVCEAIKTEKGRMDAPPREYFVKIGSDISVPL